MVYAVCLLKHFITLFTPYKHQYTIFTLKNKTFSIKEQIFITMQKHHFSLREYCGALFSIHGGEAVKVEDGGIDPITRALSIRNLTDVTDMPNANILAQNSSVMSAEAVALSGI